jgi:D-threo-aldose 1-dehydrogenase
MLTTCEKRAINRNDLRVSTLGLGGTGLANLYAAIADDEATRLVRGAQALGVSFFDTAPCYGVGLSEQRLGTVLPSLSRDSFVLSTKVGYDLVSPAKNENPGESLFVDSPRLTTRFDFSYDAAIRSIEGSLSRLGIDRIDMVAIHDPDQTAGADPNADPYAASLFDEAMAGAYRALDELRSQKVIGAIGVGMNQWQMLVDFAQAGDFDYFLCAGRYTLLRADAGKVLLPLCQDKGISVIIGGPYSSGILASGAVPGAMFDYAPASAEVMARVRALEALCTEHGISLRAAALQFPLRHPAVASVIPGARSLAELHQNAAALTEPVPDAFWHEITAQGLIEGDSTP